MQVTVDSLVTNLFVEEQGAVTVSKEAMLAYLRERFHSDRNVKGILVDAARRRARGVKVFVEYDEGQYRAALAVGYVIRQLSAKLEPPKKSACRVVQQRKRKRQPQEFYKRPVFINGRKVWLERYYPNMTPEQAQRYMHNPDYDIGDFTFQEAFRSVSETAHFESSEQHAGFGALYCDGEFIESVNCWHDDPLENYEYEQWLLNR